ncbi:VTT domain-containing protein [Cohnella thailandensis]|uniref:VTT domain-containing protein n=1 Tax=Cohnella thailandensis TaxID=557557 RepID=A0A841T1Y4_9BACL|nr:VTT domain-containing protein [Cohnella thailandensis]MBB6636595.1 VTT domain-containing protein [Cohnella thailandensis]MBP1973531.1 membrane protein DedA with SNARE-associated domain [Cohnella thailandensis]
MDSINEMLTRLLESYGYVVLFFAMMLEMMALPLPGELIMTYAGLIVYGGHMNWIASVAIAGVGTSLGMTAAYWIGYRLGYPFFEKYGRRFHLGPDKMRGISKWFDRYGSKMLLVAYFIPGVRHITGYFSGTTRMPFRKYAVYAYSGAFFWVFLFVTLGKVLGPKWQQYHAAISSYMLAIGILAAILYLTFSYLRKNQSKLKIRLESFLRKSVRQLRTAGKIQLLILSACVLFLVFFAFTIGLIQDFLAHEFTRFDEVAGYIVARMFTPDWLYSLERVVRIGTYPYLFVPMTVALIAVVSRVKHRSLELAFFAIAMAGGEGLDEALRRMFRYLGPIESQYSFPSEQVFMTVTVYGFSAFLLMRHRKESRFQVAALFSVMALCVLVGIGSVYTGKSYPSDAAAGLVFGGLWFTLNVAALEIYRAIRSKRLWTKPKLAV